MLRNLFNVLNWCEKYIFKSIQRIYFNFLYIGTSKTYIIHFHISYKSYIYLYKLFMRDKYFIAWTFFFLSINIQLFIFFPKNSYFFFIFFVKTKHFQNSKFSSSKMASSNNSSQQKPSLKPSLLLPQC